MNKNFDRRRFLQVTSLSLAATALGGRFAPKFFTPPPAQHLGLQLWSIRDDMTKDPAGTVKALAGMGYREVEGFGYNAGKMFGMPFMDFVKLLKDNGIKMPSSHVPFTLKDYDADKKMLSDSAKKSIDDAVAAGQRYIINPWMGEPERSQIDKLVKVYQAAGEYAKKAGVRFGYHNHNFEFTTKGPDGRLVYEWILQEVDPKVMTMEMDLYWVAFANYNPLDWFERYPGRFELCHAKDIAKTEKRESIEVGDGSLDFNAIFKKSRQAGLQYYIIELENYVTTPIQGVKRCRENFLKLKF